jgi:hypothetical protein
MGRHKDNDPWSSCEKNIGLAQKHEFIDTPKHKCHLWAEKRGCVHNLCALNRRVILDAMSVVYRDELDR